MTATPKSRMLRLEMGNARKSAASKGASQSASKSRAVVLLERELAAKTLVRTASVSNHDIAAAEAELGQKLPTDYVALVRAVGAFQDAADRGDYDFAGWSGTLHRLMGPSDAVLYTKKMRVEAGPGRHEKLAADTFFFLRWESTMEAFGVDSKGAVRVYRRHRPGTLLRVAYPSLEHCLVDKIGELDPARSVADVSDPSSVTHLELTSPAELGKLKGMLALEKLSVGGLEEGAPLSVVQSLTKLRELHVNGDVIDLPDAVFLAPSLERIELSNPEMQKRYSGGLNGVLKWFHTADVPLADRPRYIRILIDDETWLKKHARVGDLLAALDAPNERIVENALRALEPHLDAPPKNLRGARVVILGRTASKAGTLATQLAGAGASLDKKLSPDTTFAVIGAGPKGAHQDAKKRKVPLVLETQLRRVLDAKGARYLARERGEGAANLREMLLSTDPANIVLAVRMMEEGGVPDGVLDAILLVTQNPKADPKARKTLEKLANEKLPTFSKIVRDVFARTNLFASGATKLADRLQALHVQSKGAIDAHAIALQLIKGVDRDRAWVPALLYALETGDQTFAFEALSLARHGDTLPLGSLESRAGAAIDKAAPALARMTGVRELSVSFNLLSEVPRALAPFTSVRVLDLGTNALKSLPDWLATFSELESIDLSDNRFSVFPPVLLRLGKLRTLTFHQGDAPVRLRELPEAIAALGALENITLGSAKLPTLPEALGKLPNLKTLDLAGATIGAWPASLADAPKLESVDLQWVDTDDKAGLKAFVAKAKARGVSVTT